MGEIKTKKIYRIIITSAIIFSILLSSMSISAEKQKTVKQTSHIISNVPYVSQQTDFYCTFACPTMAIKYFNINTSLSEIVYNSGGGYSLIYSPPILKRHLVGCNGGCRWKIDREFLAELYGLSYDMYWPINTEYSEEQHWNEYWSRVKENISNNIPVMTMNDPTVLPSLRKCIQEEFNLPSKIVEKIPDTLWGLFPSVVSHMIVIVGYNEENNTLCFNDPAAALFGYPQHGKYIWMDITSFRKAMKRITPHSSAVYLIETFKENPNEPFDKNTLFEKAHQRNLKKMNGDTSVYDHYVSDDWNCSSFGINGLKEAQTHFSKGIQNRIKTILYYKLISLYLLFSASYKIYFICEKLFPEFIQLEDYEAQMSYFYRIAIQKQNMSHYLSQLKNKLSTPELIELCEKDAELLNQDSQLFYTLSENYLEFHKKGLFMTLPNGIQKMKNMENIVSEIILTEQKIIT